MNILVLNGSPRKGNTTAAIEAFSEGASLKHNVEVVDTYKLNVKPCKGCNACQCKNGCIDKDDDTNMIVDKIVAADIVVFATPVYWWGMTASLKLVIDKCFCKGSLLRDKVCGTIVVGGDSLEHKQYQLIIDQFECASDYLGWKFLFHNSYSANAKNEIKENTQIVEELKNLGKNI